MIFWPLVPDGELQRGGPVPNPAAEGGRQHSQRQLGPRPDQGANHGGIHSFLSSEISPLNTAANHRSVFSSLRSAFDIF
jgi:hypothetical protein